jgi:hypothetical protein
MHLESAEVVVVAKSRARTRSSFHYVFPRKHAFE